jgi:integrase/recombinase XerD
MNVARNFGCIPILRDSYAVWLLEMGCPTEDVATLLGHSSISITEKHYLPWIETRARRMFDRVKLAYERWELEKQAQEAKEKAQVEGA